MIVLSPRFAVLACFCAAIPLALPHVEAVHLRGQSIEKHTSSSAATHSYGGKNHERKVASPCIRGVVPVW